MCSVSLSPTMGRGIPLVAAGRPWWEYLHRTGQLPPRSGLCSPLKSVRVGQHSSGQVSYKTLIGSLEEAWAFLRLFRKPLQALW